MKLPRFHYLLLFLLAAVWLFDLLLATRVADYALTHHGDAILRAGKGKIINVVDFVQNRIRDGAWLTTAAVALAYLHMLLASLFIKPATSRTIRWPFHSVVLFVSVNAWLAVAMQTGLFWSLLFQGTEGGAENYAPFELKYCLLRESKAPLKAVIMGNSQANRQMDEGLMNEILAGRLYTGELHWPGSHGYDTMLVHRRTSPAMAQIVICYVSEGNFYTGAAGESLPQFFLIQDVPDFWNLNLMHFMPARKIGYGLLGNVLPCFAVRDPLSQRVIGLGVTGIKQREINTSSTNNIEQTAHKVASVMAMNNTSDFQKKSFELFASECGRRNQKLVILVGQLNPLLSSLLPPEMRKDMLAFLNDLKKRHPHVILVDDLPVQEASQYVDLTHIYKENEVAFTRWTAQKLVDLKLVPPPNQ